MANEWINKVKAYQVKHNVTYKEALIACGSGKTKKRVPKKKKVKKGQAGGLLPFLPLLAGLAVKGAVTGAASYGTAKALEAATK